MRLGACVLEIRKFRGIKGWHPPSLRVNCEPQSSSHRYRMGKNFTATMNTAPPPYQATSSSPSDPPPEEQRSFQPVMPLASQASQIHRNTPDMAVQASSPVQQRWIPMSPHQAPQEQIFPHGVQQQQYPIGAIYPLNYASQCQQYIRTTQGLVAVPQQQAQFFLVGRPQQEPRAMVINNNNNNSAVQEGRPQHVYRDSYCGTACCGACLACALCTVM